MALLIVIPLSESDLPILEPFLSVIEHFGGLEKNPVLVVAAQSVQAQGVEAADRLRRISKSCTLLTIPTPKGGWPMGPNEQFMRTVNHLRDSKNTEPWLWLEADAFPIKTGWASTLLAAYNEADLPFMGRLITTMDCCDKPDHPSAKVQFDGKHMNGVGIYPADFWKRSQLYKMANRESKPVGFDIYCRWEIAPNCHDPGLIAGVRRATKFQKDKDGYTCMSEGVEKTIKIGEEVLLHSCKDGSLATLITGKTWEAKEAQERLMSGAVTVVDVLSAAGLPFPYGMGDTVSPGGAGASPAEFAGSRSVELHPESPGAEGQKPASFEESAKASATYKLIAEAEAEFEAKDRDAYREAAGHTVSASAESTIPDQIEELIPSGKSIRIGELARRIGIKRHQLEALIEASERFTLKAPGWVSRKAA